VESRFVGNHDFVISEAKLEIALDREVSLSREIRIALESLSMPLEVLFRSRLDHLSTRPEVLDFGPFSSIFLDFRGPGNHENGT